MTDSVRSLAEIENIHCSPLTYPGGSFLIEGDEVGQAWFAFGESMLTIPGHVLVIHVQRDGFQNKVFCPLSRDWCEAVWPVILGYICILPVSSGTSADL